MSDNLPPITIETCDSGRREPGMMVFNVRPGAGGSGKTKGGWIIAVAQSGDIAFSLKLDAPTQDVRRHPNGNLVFSQTGIGLMTEIDPSGQTLRQWHANGKWTDKNPPPGSIAIDAPFITHTINVLPNGNFLLLTAETRDYENWPASETDPNAGTRTATLVGDVILEVTQAGTIAGRWHMLDIFDPYRICYGSTRDYWDRHGFTNSNDWCHANSIAYDPRDDTILVSLRTQDCIAKIARGSGELRWILGTHANWRAPWTEKLLHPVGNVEWAYHQHDASVTPSGTILCFDNGNHRATPFAPKQPAEENYSRIVEFEVDEAARTVRQIWSYGEPPAPPLFGRFQGGAFRLPQTGNTFATFGGLCTSNGIPVDEEVTGFCRAQLLELTPDKQIVFDLRVDGSATDESLSVFRAEHVPRRV